MNGSRAAIDTTSITPSGRTRRSSLVDPDWLGDHLDDPGVRIVQVDVTAARYDRAHLPGAVLWNIYTDMRDPEFQLVDAAAVNSLVQRAGIHAETLVVFTGYAPALGLWLMQAHGHRHLGLLDLALDTWEAEGLPVATSAPQPRSSGYQLAEANPALRARREDVIRAIEDRDTVVLDVRSEAEYRGDQFWPSGGQQVGGRAGHVPAAIHVPIDGLLDGRGAFRGTRHLSRALAAADPPRPGGVITYCTIGARAATAWFVMTHLLGRDDVRVYDGSWAEWGLGAANPVDR